MIHIFIAIKRAIFMVKIRKQRIHNLQLMGLFVRFSCINYFLFCQYVIDCFYLIEVILITSSVNIMSVNN